MMPAQGKLSSHAAKGKPPVQANLGLRVDVDTLSGTRQGVPTLCRLFRRHGIRASFFFSVGPDNMGRHVWRLLRPVFLVKMMRSRAASLYGWDILLRGTFWPGPDIGIRAGAMIRAAADDGHEIGLHAWDHHAWQARIEGMDAAAIGRVLRRGFERLTTITGNPPVCSAVPAWRCTPAALTEKLAFPFSYNSDCRGRSIFYPVVDGHHLPQPQIPVTLPTYDEVIGRDGITNANYNDHLLDLIQPGRLNVLTIHAEVEGGACEGMFAAFLNSALAREIRPVPLGVLLDTADIGVGEMIRGTLAGREGWLSRQREENR
jgi:undecaprenyl phosphate-alpha-L-ara4FN deformylase